MGVAEIVPWGADGLELLTRLNGDPLQMAHLGGPETPAKIAERQERYSRPDSCQFQIIDSATGEAAGWVGFWEREWRAQPVFETGWSVLAQFQGRGLASAATRLLLARAAPMATDERRFVHAFPGVENAASNAVCRSAGFALLGAIDFEYPPGQQMRCNDWRFALR